MAKEGWIRVRSTPVKNCDTSTLNRDIEKFFEKHKTCNKCDGHGYVKPIYSDDIKDIDIRFQNIPDLAKLKNFNGVNLSTKIRLILEYEYLGLRFCDKCHGFGFVKK